MKLKLNLSKVNKFYNFLFDRFQTFKPDKVKLFQAAFDFVNYNNNKKLSEYLKEISGAKTTNEIIKILNGEDYANVSPVPSTSETKKEV